MQFTEHFLISCMLQGRAIQVLYNFSQLHTAKINMAIYSVVLLLGHSTEHTELDVE